MHVKVDYPDAQHEKDILHLARREAKGEQAQVNDVIERMSQHSIFEARKEVLSIFMTDQLEDYLLQLILATRKPEAYGSELASWIQYGASPRASIALDRCARARAWLQQRDFVTPEDIQSLAFDVLRHRLILTYEAEAEGITTDRVIQELIARVAVP